MEMVTETMSRRGATSTGNLMALMCVADSKLGKFGDGRSPVTRTPEARGRECSGFAPAMVRMGRSERRQGGQRGGDGHGEACGVWLLQLYGSQAGIGAKPSADFRLRQPTARVSSDLAEPFGQGVLVEYPMLMQTIKEPKDAVALDRLL